MRSHLTRNVCRRVLLRQSPVQHCRTLSSHAFPIREARTLRPRTLVRRPSRRTFFNLFKKPPRELKEPGIEPGYIALLQFISSHNNNVRPPPRGELLNGFQTFFRHKAQDGRRPINTTQAFVAAKLLQHLQVGFSEGGELTLEDLRLVRDVVLRPPKGAAQDHLDFSKQLYTEIKKRTAPGEPAGSEATSEDYSKYVQALTQYGASLEAAELLTTELQKTDAGPARMQELGITVLRGLAAEGKGEELKDVAMKFKWEGFSYSPIFHELMTTFYAKQNSVKLTKYWFKKLIDEGQSATPKTYKELMWFAVRNDLQEWAQPYFEKAMESNPDKETWHVLLQWQVFGLNKGCEDVKAILGRGSGEGGPSQEAVGLVPDTSTINCLIEAAVAKKDSYLAERFISLSADLGIPPDARTYLLQLNHRLEAKDFGGAHVMYEKITVHQAENDEDLPLINKYIRAMSSARQLNIERILEVASALEHRGVTLEPETTLALCKALLMSDRQYDVIDTLSLHTVQYSLEERVVIRTGFVQYCLDKSTSTARAWDAYSLLRQFFPETEQEERTQLMDAFFERKRPDMACHIFGHMRAHKNPTQRPGADAYVKCLEGIWRCPDEDGLQMVHNMLKMDMTIQMNTRLYNALMLAYTGCERPSAAFDFWTNITQSVEGPTYNSIAIAFKVCQALPDGVSRARQIWHKTQKMNLDIPPLVYGSYCEAIAVEGDLEEVKKLLQAMFATVGCQPNFLVLGGVYNALPGEELKEDFTRWANKEFRSEWNRISKRRGSKVTNLDGITLFNLVSNLKA